MVIDHGFRDYLSRRKPVRDGSSVVRIVLFGAVLLLAAVAIWRPAPLAAPAPVPVAKTASVPMRQHRARPASSTAVVYVAGAVAHPGLYAVRPGDRAADAVRLAGGLASGADAVAVNLAARVQDGDEIAVPSTGESVRAARSRKKTSSTRKHAETLAVVNVNTADAPTLALVPGIGPLIARRIIALRENEGPYESLDQLLDVAGMTPSKLDRAGSYLSI